MGSFGRRFRRDSSSRQRSGVKAITGFLAAMRVRASRVKAFLRLRRDGWLHSGRHRRARERIRRLSRPRRIVVICHGNICRSPYLEAVLRRALPDIEVSSAGFVGPGRMVPEYGTAAASRRGLDLTSHRSQLLSKEILGRADLVIAMDPRQARFVVRQLGYPAGRIIIAGDLDPRSGEYRAIRDPWRQPLDIFESSYTRLDRCAAVLAEILPSRTP